MVNALYHLALLASLPYQISSTPIDLPVPNPLTGEVELPGNANDPRGLPNLPFTVDANRFSDGISSVSPLTTSGSSFPAYRGTELVDPTLRFDHAKLVKADRERQGYVKNLSGGSYEREKARLDRLVEMDPNGVIDLATGDWGGAISGSAPATTFGVDAKLRWNPSTFAIQPGETYQISIPNTPIQYWEDNIAAASKTTYTTISSTAEGYDVIWDARKRCYKNVDIDSGGIDNGKCRSYLRQNKRFKEGKWFSLICGVASFGTSLSDAPDEVIRFLPIKEETVEEMLFLVPATSLTFTALASQEGELLCFANDAEGLYNDNAGIVNVHIERLSWPPSIHFDENYQKYLMEGLQNPSIYDN